MWSGGKDGKSVGAHQGKQGRGENFIGVSVPGIQCRAFCPLRDKKLLNVVGAIGEKFKLSNIFPLQVIKTKFEVFLILRK